MFARNQTQLMLPQDNVITSFLCKKLGHNHLRIAGEYWHIEKLVALQCMMLKEAPNLQEGLLWWSKSVSLFDRRLYVTLQHGDAQIHLQVECRTADMPNWAESVFGLLKMQLEMLELSESIQVQIQASNPLAADIFLGETRDSKTSSSVFDLVKHVYLLLSHQPIEQPELLSVLNALFIKNSNYALKLEQAARQLGVSKRTLQRRLQEKQMSYSQCVDFAKRKQALTLLADTQLDVEQVGGTVFKQQIMSNWAEAPEQLVADENGHVTLELPAKSAVIYSKTSSNQSVDTPDLNIQLAQDWEGQTITGDIVIAGSANANEKLDLVVDGNLETAQTITVGADGQFSVTLSTRHFAIGEQQHRFAIYSTEKKAGIEDVNFVSNLSWSNTPDDTIDDAGDAQDGMSGPNGNYLLPTDPTFDKDSSQLAINKAEVFTVGSNVRLTFTMDKITDTWLPPNGFDHVGFTIFIDLPEEAATNLSELPKINASMPNATWSRNAVVFGWQSSIYNTKGANATTWGEAVTPAPTVTVDKANNTISMDFASDALGRPDSLDGIRFYVTTWDLDGLSATYRPLEQDKGPWNFSGGASDESKIWDDLPIITLSE